jgi:hypothetical protein
LSGSEPSKAGVGVGQQNLGVVELGHRTTFQDQNLGGIVSSIAMDEVRVHIPCRS